MSGSELDELAGVMDESRQELRRSRDRVNDEVRQQEDDDSDVRLGPVPVSTGPAEPVWIAVPLRREGEEGEQRAEEQQAVSEEVQQQRVGEAGEKDDKHIHRQLPEDRATGRPEKETGVSAAQTHSLLCGNTSHTAFVHLIELSGCVMCGRLADWSNKESGRILSTQQQQLFTSPPSVAAMIGQAICSAHLLTLLYIKTKPIHTFCCDGFACDEC